MKNTYLCLVLLAENTFNHQLNASLIPFSLKGTFLHSFSAIKVRTSIPGYFLSGAFLILHKLYDIKRFTMILWSAPIKTLLQHFHHPGYHFLLYVTLATQSTLISVSNWIIVILK